MTGADRRYDKSMTIWGIKQRVIDISISAWDDEKAHVMEDKLMIDFIEFVSDSDSKYAEMARLVLTSQSIKFARHCA